MKEAKGNHRRMKLLTGNFHGVIGNTYNTLTDVQVKAL